MSNASEVGEVSGISERYVMLCRKEERDGLEGLRVSSGSGQS
jgi:hypothetical protein